MIKGREDKGVVGNRGMGGGGGNGGVCWGCCDCERGWDWLGYSGSEDAQGVLDIPVLVG